jgi:hypothetical protein
MIAVLVCFVLAALVMIFSILFDIKVQHRERAAGKNVLWYKRSPLFGSGGGLCLIISDTLIVLMVNNTLPPVLFFYILVSLLIVCGLCSIIYSLKLALHQRKLAFDQQKDQNLQ